MAEQRKDDAMSTVAAGMSTAAAIAAAMAWIAATTQRARAAPGEIPEIPGIPEELVRLIIAIATSADAVDDNTRDIIDAIRALSIQVQGFPPNTDNMIATRVQIAAVNRFYQLPDIAVPDGFFLQLKGWPTNGGQIYVGNSRGTATNINQIWPLIANEAIGYGVKNANVLYISGTQAGDWLGITVEQRRR